MKTTKFKKRVISACLAVMLVASIGVLSVSASNHSDTSYSFSFSPTHMADYTGPRQKLDNSSVYMLCNSIYKSYTAHVVAEPDTSSTIIDVSGNHTYQFVRVGDWHKMINYAKEWGYNWAGIIGTSDYSTYSSASGVWSPDSI